MLGLAILFIFGTYLAISIFATRYVMAWARESGRRAWLWGCIAGLAMYNLVFWDMIPTLVMHKYYCSTQAGFWPYKSFEQWESENPGVTATLSMRHGYRHGEKQAIAPPPNTRRDWYTTRFYRDSRSTDYAASIIKVEEIFVDAVANSIIATSINFIRGLPANTLSAGGSPGEIRKSLILGWGERQCVLGGSPIQDTFQAYIFNFWKAGKGK